MSGGTLHPEYCYYMVSQFADELENKIENNDRKDEWGYCPGYGEDVLSYLREQIPILRKMSQVMRDIDYLYSGDHGEDSFLERVKKIS